jgi:hypothetical protein
MLWDFCIRRNTFCNIPPLQHIPRKWYLAENIVSSPHHFCLDSELLTVSSRATKFNVDLLVSSDNQQEVFSSLTSACCISYLILGGSFFLDFKQFCTCSMSIWAVLIAKSTNEILAFSQKISMKTAREKQKNVLDHSLRDKPFLEQEGSCVVLCSVNRFEFMLNFWNKLQQNSN